MIQYGEHVVPMNIEYHVVEVVEGTFKIRSTLVDRWKRELKDVVVLDKAFLDLEEPRGMLMTIFEFDSPVDLKPNAKKYKSHQEGYYINLTYRWLTDRRIIIDEWDKLLLKRFNSDWVRLLDRVLHSEYFQTLNKVKQKAARKNFTVYPARDKVFRAYESRPDMIKVVIVGQDPYPNGEANGLAFAVDEKVKVPPSLKMIEEALFRTLPIEERSKHYLPTLDWWQKQGVMLLNSALSVKAKSPGSYAEDWEEFITETLGVLNNYNNQIIFVFMGSKAQAFNGIIDTSKHKVFNVEHPAAASYANRSWEDKKVFERINNMLEKPIEWLTSLGF